MSSEYRGPPALVEVAVEPKSEADRRKLDVALGEMKAEDPSFGFQVDRESGQLILTGVDEWQLDRKIEALKLVYGVQIDVGAPHVAYLETLGCAVRIDQTHKMQSGGSGQFARVIIQFEPGESDSGFRFDSRVVGGAVPEEFIPGVEKGLEAARGNGLLAGFPVTDFTATLVDGAYHDIDSSELAFEIAAHGAFKALREKGGPLLLEPIMKVEVVIPEEYLSDVIGDLDSRKGTIQGTGNRNDQQLVIALVPLANMFGYIGSLRALTEGCGEFTMQYDHYAPVPWSDPEPPGTFPPAIGMRA
jgi:elongation factor G